LAQDPPLSSLLILNKNFREIPKNFRHLRPRAWHKIFGFDEIFYHVDKFFPLGADHTTLEVGEEGWNDGKKIVIRRF
jgi:hypothetical protein